MTDYKYNAEDGLKLLVDTIRDDMYHQDYQHTVDYAKWCHQVMTGEDHGELLVKYKPSETDNQEKQRVRLYNSRTKHIGGKVSSQFLAVEKTDNVVESISYGDGKDDDQRIKELRDRTRNFYDDESLKRYLYNDVRHFNFHDPNAWLIIEATSADPREGKPWTYPFIARSSEAVRFEYHIGILQYLIVRNMISIIENPGKDQKMRNGYRFTMYGPGYAYIFQELAEKGPVLPDDSYQLMVIEKSKDKKVNYAWKYIETPVQYVPAVRYGYLKDPRTDNRTFVSPIYIADEIIKDIIITKSEYDLSKALHGFIQKYAFAKTCDYDNGHGDRCSNGTLIQSNAQCPKCKGEGILVHKTVQDVILIRTPEGPDEHIPLKDFVHYVEIPKHIIDAYKDDLKDLEKDVSLAVFNTNVFDRAEIAVTATEKRLDQEQVYNVLTPYADNWSKIYTFSVMCTAAIMEIDQGLTVDHKFPFDFKLESIYELLDMRKAAQESGAPAETIEAIDRKILAKQNRDNPEYVLQVEAREQFRPFVHLTENERTQVVAYLPDDDPEKILYMRFSTIFRNIENAEPNFYKYPYAKQKELVDSEVQKFADLLAGQKQQRTVIPAA